MRERLSRVAKQIFKKTATLSVATVMALSGLAAAGPIFAKSALAAGGNNLYVATTGADSGDCQTQATPCLTIGYAISQAHATDTINVGAGTYTENVVVNQPVTLKGAGAATIVATDANHSPLTFATDGATVDGFTITHNYTQSELSSWSFNNNGVTFNQLTSGNTLKDSTVTLSRNGVYLNRSSANIIDDTITNNRTGINLTNDVSGTAITGNTVTDNWTLGMVYYSQGYATNFDTLNVSGNTFDNWYTEIEVKDAGASTGTLDVTNNTFADSPVTYATSSSTSLNEPGFSAQQPVGLGGSATAPSSALPTLRIYNSGSVALKDDNTKTIDVLAGQSIQAAVNDAAAGDTISIANGTYNEAINITVPLILTGQSQAGVIVNQTAATPYGQGISIVGVGNVSISNMTINTPNGAPVSYALQAYQAPHLSLSNLTFNGPGKTGRNSSGGKIGGVDVNSSSNVSYNTVDVNNYSKNGLSVTSKYVAGDTASADISFKNITTDSNNWAGLAFYTVGNDKSTNATPSVGGASSITGVTFSGHNSFTNNGSQGLFIEGGPDTDFNSGTSAASYSVSGPGGLALTLTGSSFSGNGMDLENYQTGSLIATSNYWGSSSPSFSALIGGSDVTYDPWYTDPGLTTLSGTKTAPDSSGNVTINSSTPQAVITSSSQPLDVIVASGTNASLDFSALVSHGSTTSTASLPQATIQTTNAQVNIPAAVTVTANDANWDGVVNAPQVLTNTSVPVSAPAGYSLTLGTVIKVGSDTADLTFDAPVELVIPNQAEQLVGFVKNGAFTQITETCSSASPTISELTGNASGACYTTSGSDLIVWTSHFTEFVTYSQSKSNNGSGGPNSGGSSSSNGGSNTGSGSSSNSAGSSSDNGVVQGESTENGKTSSTNTEVPVANLAQPKTAAKEATGGGLRWYWVVLIVLAVIGLALTALYRYAEGTDRA